MTLRIEAAFGAAQCTLPKFAGMPMILGSYRRSHRCVETTGALFKRDAGDSQSSGGTIVDSVRQLADRCPIFRAHIVIDLNRETAAVKPVRTISSWS